MKMIAGFNLPRRRAQLLLLLLAVAASTTLFAQSYDPGSTYNNTSSYSSTSQDSSPPELTADQIITILQNNPDLVSSMKLQAQENGVTGTKEQFIQKLQTDQQFRQQVTQYLIDQGAVDPNDPRLH